MSAPSNSIRCNLWQAWADQILRGATLNKSQPIQFYEVQFSDSPSSIEFYQRVSAQSKSTRSMLLASMGPIQFCEVQFSDSLSPFDFYTVQFPATCSPIQVHEVQFAASLNLIQFYKVQSLARYGHIQSHEVHFAAARSPVQFLEVQLSATPAPTISMRCVELVTCCCGGMLSHWDSE